MAKTADRPSPLGRRVRKLRRLGKISARSLSLKIGASQSVIGQLERGQIRALSAALLLSLARSLGTSPEYLQDGTGEPPAREVVIAALRAGEAVAA